MGSIQEVAVARSLSFGWSAHVSSQSRGQNVSVDKITQKPTPSRLSIFVFAFPYVVPQYTVDVFLNI